MTAPRTLPALRVASIADIDTVADIVADSFQHLEVIHYLVPDQNRLWPISRAWYRLYIEHASTGAGEVMLTEDASAASVWFDRTGDAGEPDNYAARLADLAGADLPQFEHLDQEMDTHHPADPHWHLLFLAVRPDRWGQGLGSHLMQHTHRWLDTDGIPAYLEATGPDNRRLYQRHGYADMTPPTIPVTDDIVLHRMWRPAQPR